MEIKKDVEIKVISQEESLKMLGELLSNETSRNLMRFLMNKSTYKKKISDETKLPFPLVEHHLKKMEKLGLVKITNKKLIKGGVPHKTYKITADGIFLMLNTTDEEIEKNGVIKKAFKSGIKFASIGIIGIMTWALSKTITPLEDGMIYYEFSEEKSFFESLDFYQFLPIIASHVVVILLIYFLIKKRKGN